MGFLLAGGLGLAFWWNRPAVEPVTLPEIPVLDMSRVDANAGLTLQRRIEQVRADPRSAQAWGELGGLLVVYQFPQEAALCLETAQKLEPNEARWPYYLSRLWRVERPEEALTAAVRAARLAPHDNLKPGLELARLLFEKGRMEETRAELDRLLALNDRYAPAQLLLAQVERQLGNPEKARALAEACREDRRTAKAAWNLLTALYRRSGLEAEAAEAASRAAELPEDEEEEDAYQEALADLRGDPRGDYHAAHDLLAAGNVEETLPLVERLRRQHPDDAETWLISGRLRFLQKDAVGAEQDFRRLMELDPDSTQGLFQLGLALLAQQQDLEAAAMFHQATKIKADFGPAYFNRAFALNRAGRSEEAIAAFNDSLAHNPEHLDSYFFLVDLYLRTGRKELAAETLAKGRLLAPEDRRVPYWEARLAESP